MDGSAASLSALAPSLPPDWSPIRPPSRNRRCHTVLGSGPAITPACQTESPMLLLRASSRCQNTSSLLAGASGQPTFPHRNAPTVLCMRLFPLLCTLGISAHGRSCAQLVVACLGLAPSAAMAKKCSPLSKRGSAELGFISY